MVKGILILLFFCRTCLFSAQDIESYFGIWKGEAYDLGKKYSVYVNFPGLGESKIGYYKACEEKNPNKGYNGSFWVKEEKKDFYKAKIKSGAGKFKNFFFPVEANMEKGVIVLDSFFVKGDISLEDENTAVFSFVNDFTQIKGRLKRLKEKSEKKSSDKSNKSKKSKNIYSEKIKPVEKKKI
ncbi:MAG: hypothetical protein AB1637_03060 [Elusimicrobiota bacterium]